MHRLSWVVGNLASAPALLATIFYWGAFRRDLTNGEDPTPLYLEIILHAGGSIIVILDLIASAREWRLQHAYMPAAFMIW